jgi:hypothetical protein
VPGERPSTPAPSWADRVRPLSHRLQQGAAVPAVTATEHQNALGISDPYAR